MPPPLDAEIARLFQLPLAEFTTARNALAKSAGKQGAAIKALAKPPVAAWAVNQLFWKDRDRYDALIDAARDMRKAHKAVMEGKTADLRAAGREHEMALDAALKATVALMKKEGQPATDATRQAVLNTLRALPSEEPPGRLTRVLAPGGFEMLAGIEVQSSAGPKGKKPTLAAVPQARESRSTAAPSREKEREAARAREQRAALERAVRDADQKARHAEFEAARAVRDEARARKRADAARQALEEAQADFDDADAALEAATKAREAAEAAVKDSAEALTAAKKAIPDR